MLKATFPQALLLALVAFLAIAAAGCGGPSDADIEKAVREHYESGSSTDGLMEVRTQVNIVRVLKRGEAYGSWLTGSTMYPVRVHVQGTTIRGGRLFPKTQSSFEHTEEFQITWQEPDRSRVDPGPGRWVVGLRTRF